MYLQHLSNVMKFFLSLALLSLAAPLCSTQAAVNGGIIPADARWVVYVDLNAMRATTLGKELVSKVEKAEFGSKNSVGVDVNKLMATVGTLTAYGSNFSSDPKAIDGALVAQGSPELRKIAEGLLIQQSVASPEAVVESNALPFPSYIIKDKHNGADAVGVIIAFPPEPIILVSKSAAQIVKAHEAFLGSAPTVAKTKDALLRDLLQGSADTYVFAASVVPPDLSVPDNQPQARILKMATSGSLAVGERGPNTFAHVELLASSDQMADKLMKIVQGTTAMLSLAESSDRQLGEFLNSAVVERKDRVVTLNLSYPSERIAQMIRSFDVDQGQGRSNSGPRGVAGTTVAQWKSEAAPAGSATGSTVKTIDNVALQNGDSIYVTRQTNGGKPVRIERIEVIPVGGGAPLTFRADLLPGGGRNATTTFQFPGTDGAYTLKVGYENDPEGKAAYTVSIRHPRQIPPAPESAPAPAAAP